MCVARQGFAIRIGMKKTLFAWTGLAVIGGGALTYWKPDGPILAYWLSVALGIGLYISFASAFTGLRQRLQALIILFASLILFSLITTQVAARRAISSTHLVYRGVHLVGIDSFTVGSVSADPDIRLDAGALTPMPWSVRLYRDDAGWSIEPLSGVEQVRIRDLEGTDIKTLRGRYGPAPSIEEEYRVLQAVIVDGDGDNATILGPDGTVAERLQLSGDRLFGQSSFRYLKTDDDVLSQRYRRQLLNGTTLASLEGGGSNTWAVLEHFVRIQRLPSNHMVNGSVPPIWRRFLFAPKRYLIAAAPPFRINGQAISEPAVVAGKSALVEVRNGEGRWTFLFVPDWRRVAAAERGVAVLFSRNPKPLDAPLPAGVSCPPDAACGAISLRRLPPPIAHIALDHAGFNPEQFGLLGMLRPTRTGFEIVVPGEIYTVPKQASRPVAVPVATFSSTNNQDVRGRSNARWILLEAAGTGDNMATVIAVGLGLALLLYGIWSAAANLKVAGRIAQGEEEAPPAAIPHPSGQVDGTNVHPAAEGQVLVDSSSRANVPAVQTQTTLPHPSRERAIALGFTAVLGLILSRVIVGARTSFFDPFLERGLQTAIGLCVAIALVLVGLLAWSGWVPALLARAHTMVTGGATPSGAFRGSWEVVAGLLTISVSQGWPVLVALPLLIWVSGWAAFYGVVVGLVLLLGWICVGWILSCTGRRFDTYESGVHSVIEQLSQPAVDDSDRILEARGQEVSLIVGVLLLTLAHMFAYVGLLAALIGLVAGVVVVSKRRRSRARRRQPDFVAALLGIAIFAALIAGLRIVSQNGSLGAFVLVVLAALSSVRVGRAVGARLEKRGIAERASGDGRQANDLRLEGLEENKSDQPLDRRGRPARNWLVDAVLLTTPLLLLLPLATLDMGLALVLVLPLGFATLLSAGLRSAGWRLIVPVGAIAILLMLGATVLFPYAAIGKIRDAESHAAQAREFASLSRVFGVRIPGLATPMDRAAARSLATHDRELAEKLMVVASPGAARDLLLPSIEQVWGSRAYSSAGVWGEGLGRAAIGGRGIAETVSYAENTFAVFILAEHGAVGGTLVLLLYTLIVVAVAMLTLGRAGSVTPSYRASRALFFVAALIITIPAYYVALSNLGVIPITGQNMPFLGLNAWSDVAICAGTVGILVTGTLRGFEERES